LAEIGLEELTVDEARKLVYDTSVASVEAANDAIKDSIKYAKKLGIPLLVHTSTPTMDAVLLAAKELGPKLIALHVNGSTFKKDEAVRTAKQLRSLGAKVEVISTDAFRAKQIHTSTEVTFTLLKERLADYIATDFEGGYHDPILLALQKAIEENVIPLPYAIKLATSAPAQIVPNVAPNRGLIAPGKIADLCIVDRDDISKVNYVIIGGNVEVEDGRIVRDCGLHN
jgi:imidazolonepropionase-like amidohydrolase